MALKTIGERERRRSWLTRGGGNGHGTARHFLAANHFEAVCLILAMELAALG